MSRKKYFIVVILFFSAIYVTRANSTDDISISAKSAIIAEASTGKILYEKNPDLRLEPASTVKVMTAILALEAFPRDKEITLTSSVNHVDPVVINLKSGVSYKVEDLIYALLVKSANNAAVAISESISGSEREFINLMNDKAHAIGMKDTHFTSSSGLPYGNRKDQYTTARDMITLMRYASKNKMILEAMSKKEVVIKGNNGHTIRLESHNKSLFTENNALWGKTGYTRTAKRTFVGVDPTYKPKIVVALLKSDDLWRDISVLKRNGLNLYDKRHRFFLFKIVDLVFG